MSPAWRPSVMHTHKSLRYKLAEKAAVVTLLNRGALLRHPSAPASRVPTTTQICAVFSAGIVSADKRHCEGGVSKNKVLPT